MFRFAIEGAWRVDRWLKERVGRAYTILLTAALIAGVAASARTVVREVRSAGNLIVAGLTVALYLILLINQLAQLHEYRQAVRAHREARRAKRRQS